MSINRFGTVFASAHAGMTAEGDNSVLMQKVAKEHMGLFKPHTLERPHDGVIDPENPHHLMYLLKARENQLHSELHGKLKKAFAYTTVGKKISGFGLNKLGSNLMEKGVFNTWMYEEQDKIQAFAKSYADRLVAEAFLETISENTGKGQEYKDCPIGNVQLFINLFFILYARWRFKIVCFQTKLVSLAICKKRNYYRFLASIFNKRCSLRSQISNFYAF